jgi:antitoxin PrlF
MIIRKLMSKGQTTIPQAVRAALGLQPGDSVAYHIQEGRAVLTRFSSVTDQDDPFGRFEEWASAADENAYGGL